MRIAVTGGSGHIGGNLIRALVAEGHSVRALVYEDTRSLDGLPVERIQGELADASSLQKVFEGCEVVYHLAGRISILPDDEPLVRKVNVDGTRSVVAACLDAKIRRLVHFSSIHAIDPYPVAEPILESRGLNAHPETLPYDRSKADGEREVQAGIAKGLDAVIVNPTGVMGPLDFKPGLCGQILVDLYYKRLPALVDAGFNFVDVRDVVAGAMAAEKKGRRGERYMLPGNYVRLPDLAKIAEEVSGIKSPRMVAPMWLARIGAPFLTAWAKMLKRQPLYTSGSLQVLRHHQDCSVEKSARELDYKPRPFRDTVVDSYASFREIGIVK